jgi:hypothetical protein
MIINLRTRSWPNEFFTNPQAIPSNQQTPGCAQWRTTPPFALTNPYMEISLVLISKHPCGLVIPEIQWAVEEKEILSWKANYHVEARILVKRNLKRQTETRSFVGVFGGYWKWSHRLGKKIGCRKFFDFWRKIEKFPRSIFLPSLRIHV